jgi:hypothetical protein
MPVWRLRLLFILLLACSACSLPPVGRPRETTAAPIRDLGSVHHRLQAADSASVHQLLTEIGRINVPGFEAPIWRVAYRTFQADLKQVLILAGLHGDETAGVDYVMMLLQRLGSTPAAAVLCDMDIFPLLNPWGWVHDTPFTPAGIDLAADFNGFKSTEAKALRRFLRAKRYDLVVDLREDPGAAGFYLRQYGTDQRRTATRILDRIRAAGHPIEDDRSGIWLRPKDGIVAVPLWGLTVLRLSRQLTLGGFLRQNVSSNVFSLVTPAALPSADRIAMQQIAVETLLSEYVEDRH